MSVFIKKAYRQALLIIFDILSVFFAAIAAILLKENFSLPFSWPNLSVQFAVFYAVLVLAFGYTCKNYSAILRYFSIKSAIRQVVSLSLAWFVVLFSFYLSGDLNGEILSLSVIVVLIHCFIAIAARTTYRIIKRERWNVDGPLKRVIIVGSGHAASLLLKDMAAHKEAKLKPVALLDDKPSLKGRYLHGIPVVGTSQQVEFAIDKYDADMVILSIPSLKDNKIIATLSEICVNKGVELRRLPGLNDLVDGKVTVNALRRVKIEDLLGRAPIDLNQSDIANEISGRSVLVTGGGGSIGSELCRQISHYQPSKIIILELSEFNLYSIERELSSLFPVLSIVPVLGSVTDENLVENTIKIHKPDIIFHAAAYKQVPLLESQRLAAMLNNIKGTWVIAQQAQKYQVKKFILVSTDKAVNPSNVMGCTKRISEIICQLLAHQCKTKFSIVRFGNVLDSVGSVIPLFSEQIKSGGPVTVTHPDITRYFMMIPEACQLILKAAQIDGSGKIFVLDMGEPIKISDLAKKMIQLSGKVPDEDIDIEYIGLRPGEKLYEELFHKEELLHDTGEKRIFSTEKRVTQWNKAEEVLKNLISSVNENDLKTAFSLIVELVPEARLNQNE